MRVFKYRGGDKEIFERDLKSIQKNYFWASQFDKLNDPFETLNNPEPLKMQLNFIGSIFGKPQSEEAQNVQKAFDDLFKTRKKTIGIFSLSKTYNDFAY